MSIKNLSDRAASLLERLANGTPLISDGATWTYLQQHGLESWQCPEEFNVTLPSAVSGMAREYFGAGSELVLTNSFGGNRFMLGKHGYPDRVHRFNVAAARLARGQAPPDCYVVGSVGPTGEFLEPLGRVSSAEMTDAFREQMAALEEGGVDGILIETIRSLDEAVLVIKAAKDTTRLTVMASMVFEKRPNGFATLMGVNPSDAAQVLHDAGADVIGGNCGNGIDDMVDLAKEFKRVTDGYTLIHSNAGIPSIRDAEIVYPESPDDMAKGFAELAGMRINIIGGCCGTGPDHIRALTSAVRG